MTSPSSPRLAPGGSGIATLPRGLGQARSVLPAPGAEAFTRDLPDAVVRFFDTGHCALETYVEEIAVAIRAFLAV